MPLFKVSVKGEFEVEADTQALALKYAEEAVNSIHGENIADIELEYTFEIIKGVE